MQYPFFSIIISSYNQADYIEQCIQSCINQTYKKFEIIVIDNFSDDGTDLILDKFKNEIICKKIHNNDIISKSKNLGITLSKGNWLAFLDTDDYYTLDKLEIACNEIKNKNFDVFCNSEYILRDNSRPKKKEIWTYGNKNSENFFYKDLIKYGNCISQSGSIVRKNFITKKNIIWKEDYLIRNVADYDFFLNIASENGKFYFFVKPLGYHRLRLDSTTNKNIDTLFLALNNVVKDNYKRKKIDKKILNFSMINLNILELLTINKKSLSKKIFNFFIISLNNPICVFLSLYRIFVKKIKKIIYDLVLK